MRNDVRCSADRLTFLPIISIRQAGTRYACSDCVTTNHWQPVHPLKQVEARGARDGPAPAIEEGW